MTRNTIGRRRLMALGGAAAVTGLAAPAVAQTAGETEAVESAPRNIMSFRSVDWRDHFDDLYKGAILTDTRSRTLHFWSQDQSTYLLYPCSVPMSENFTKRGRTYVTLKRPNPVWIPTPNMRERDPSLPERVEPGPENPLGTRALNLSWQYYRIHGIDDERKIGRQASNGCFGLFNKHVETLFPLVEVGTQVVVI